MATSDRVLKFVVNLSFQRDCEAAFGQSSLIRRTDDLQYRLACGRPQSADSRFDFGDGLRPASLAR